MDLLIALLGWLMLATSLLAICDGLPRQIWATARTKTAPLVLRRFMAWALAAYLLRAVYAAATGSFLIALAAVPGVAGMAVLLWQSYRYPRVAPAQPVLTGDLIVVPGDADITHCYREGNAVIVEANGEAGGYAIVLAGQTYAIGEPLLH
jgi:hypothetical protein